jgi:hypothetical protein
MDCAIVALLGHNFIGRLHTAVLDSNFPFNSDLNQDIFDVHYFGRSGATTKTLLSSRVIYKFSSVENELSSLALMQTLERKPCSYIL